MNMKRFILTYYFLVNTLNSLAVLLLTGYARAGVLDSAECQTV